MEFIFFINIIQIDSALIFRNSESFEHFSENDDLLGTQNHLKNVAFSQNTNIKEMKIIKTVSTCFQHNAILNIFVLSSLEGPPLCFIKKFEIGISFCSEILYSIVIFMIDIQICVFFLSQTFLDTLEMEPLAGPSWPVLA